MKNLEMGSWHTTKSSPCFSGAVFKYRCALCHCFTKAIMPEFIKMTSKAESSHHLLYKHYSKSAAHACREMEVGILFSHFKD